MSIVLLCKECGVREAAWLSHTCFECGFHTSLITGKPVTQSKQNMPFPINDPRSPKPLDTSNAFYGDPLKMPDIPVLTEVMQTTLPPEYIKAMEEMADINVQILNTGGHKTKRREDDVPMSVRYPKYYKPVPEGTTDLDIYGVCKIFNMVDPSGALHHAIKKLLLPGIRTGGKSRYGDIKEARDTLNRWLELHKE